MQHRFKILGSGSSGNCAFLQTPDSKILIDAGFSGKRIGEMLEEIGESPENLDAVFITHEHSDHVAGLRGLAKYEKLTFFANEDTARAASRGLKRRPNWKLFSTGSTFTFRDIEVTTFTVPHDGSDPVAFSFSMGGDDLFRPLHRLAWVLDLGYAPALVKEKILAVETLVLEANHDTELLRLDTRRPWSTKQRISGRHGHLSNQAACDILREGLAQAAWQDIFLAHLSHDCNSLRAINETFGGLFEKAPRRPSVQAVTRDGQLTPLTFSPHENCRSL